jgi:hypothetical protein
MHLAHGDKLFRFARLNSDVPLLLLLLNQGHALSGREGFRQLRHCDAAEKQIERHTHTSRETEAQSQAGA